MGTERLFDKDPYLLEFEARLIESDIIEGKQRIILDRTLFYPTSGGQPCDEGEIEGVPVIDVLEEGESVVHMLDGRIGSGKQIQGKIDWVRRIDHMQQHTGQHILSQAFVEKANAGTVGFHLGSTVSTVDLNVADIPEEVLDKVEYESNAIVIQNRHVVVRTIPFEDADQIPFRKPPKGEKDIRVVEVEGFDYSGCCGTHVRTTGELGLIKVLRWERYKGGTRIAFVCGWRALRDYQKKVGILKDIGQVMTAGEDDIAAMVLRWKDDRKAASKRIRSLLEETLESEAQRVAETALQVGSHKLVSKVYENRDPDEVQHLVNKLIRYNDIVVFVGLKSERGYLYFGRGQSVDLDIRPFMVEACQIVEGKGGGGPSMARGSGKDTSRIEEAIEKIKSLYMDQMYH